MKASKWPFRPEHITNDGEACAADNPKQEELRKLNGVGIISNEHLQGIQTTICAKLENPTTIVEFSPKGEPARTDSRLLVFGAHEACKTFRCYTDAKWCLECDNIHAKLFCGLNKDSLTTEVWKRIEECDYIKKYRSDKDYEFGLVTEGNRPYLEYDCPLLGYRELLFTIFFEERLIGTLFFGQLCLEDRLDFIRKKQKEFLNTHPDCFDEYCNLHDDCTPSDIRQEILDAHRDWVTDRSHVMGKKRYPGVIKQICSELGGLETTLVEQMRFQREGYVRGVMDTRVEEFRNNLPGEKRRRDRTNLSGKEDTSEQRRALLWRNVGDQLRNLLSDFAIRYVVIFASNKPEREWASVLEVVVSSGDFPSDLGDTLRRKQLRFNLGKVPLKVRSKWVTTEEEERIFDAIEGWSGDSTEANLLRVFPVPFFPRASLAVLVGYYDWNPLHSEENYLGGHLSVALQSFYTVVLSAFSAVLAESAEERMEAALRIFGHESGQLTAGLDWLRTLYLSDVPKLRGLADEKAKDLCRDIDGYVGQLLLLSKQARILLEIGRLNRTCFLAYKELLFKWNDICRLEADRKSVQFDMCHPKPDDPLRSEIYGDQAFLEQLVYNLVTNALKYCYRGTRIHLNCQKESTERGSPHILTVTDYGTKAGGAEIYDLYERGGSASEEGLGIGLFIVKQIAAAHKGDVIHTCRKVSNYNVPLIKPVLDASIYGKPTRQAQGLERELKQLRRTGEYYKVVALGENRKQRYSSPTEGEMANSINKWTWEVSFRVTIPALEKKK